MLSLMIDCSSVDFNKSGAGNGSSKWEFAMRASLTGKRNSSNLRSCRLLNRIQMFESRVLPNFWTAKWIQ